MRKKIINYTKQNLTPILVSIICLYAIFLRIIKLHKHTLWNDEIWQLNQMSGNFLDLLNQLSMNEVCSYLSGDFYLMYPFFKLFSFNKWGLAIPHLIITIIGFYFLYRICKMYFKTLWGYLITFTIICFNLTLINHATEIRVYAVLPTLALMSFYFLQTLIDNNFFVPRRKIILFGIFFLALIWYHVYGILIFFCTLALAIINQNKDAKKTKGQMLKFFKFLLIILIIAMPFWLYCVFGPRHLLGQEEMNPAKFLKLTEFKMTVEDFIPSPIKNPTGFLKGVFGNLIGQKKLYFLLAGLIFPLIFSIKNRLKLITLSFPIIYLPIASIYIFDLIVIYFFIPRQFIWVIPIFAFYIGLLWDYFFVFLNNPLSLKIKAEK